MNGGPDMADAQRRHWQTTFQANPHMYGIDPSAPGAYAVELFGRERSGTSSNSAPGRAATHWRSYAPGCG